MDHILAAIDFSESAPAVLELTGTLAAGSGATVTLLHVAAPNPDFVGYEAGPQHVRDQRAQQLHQERRDLQHHAEELCARGLEARALVFEGATVRAILEEAERLPAELIVVGSHGRGPVARALLGSVSRGVLEGAPCPVVVVPSPERGA